MAAIDDLNTAVTAVVNKIESLKAEVASLQASQTNADSDAAAVEAAVATLNNAANS